MLKSFRQHSQRILGQEQYETLKYYCIECNHQSLKLFSVLRPIIPVLLSLLPMFLTAHWLNVHWTANSLLVLALQCMVAGVIFLVVACMVVIRSDERRKVIDRIADWNTQRRLKQVSTTVAARQE